MISIVFDGTLPLLHFSETHTVSFLSFPSLGVKGLLKVYPPTDEHFGGSHPDVLPLGTHRRVPYARHLDAHRRKGGQPHHLHGSRCVGNLESIAIISCRYCYISLSDA